MNIHRIIFNLLLVTCLILTVLIGQRFNFFQDWTENSRNSLSDSTQKLLATMQHPIKFSVFANQSTMLRETIRNHLNKYHLYHDNIQIEFINPDLEPQKVRSMNIKNQGEIVLTYQKQQRHITQLTEQAILNALQQVSKQGQQWVVFMKGHGERKPFGKANFDFGDFSRKLKQKGFNISQINLAENTIPENTGVLVIATPKTHLLDNEIVQLLTFVKQGGKILWFRDPGESDRLQPLAKSLNIKFLAGMVVDAMSYKIGLENPSFAIITRYQKDNFLKSFTETTLFPQATAIEASKSTWQAKPLLITQKRSWTETGAIKDKIRFDENTLEVAGPLNIGYSFERQLTNNKLPRQQRIIVIGDGDFLSNRYLGNAGNLNLGFHLFHWLTEEDHLIQISEIKAIDTQMLLSEKQLTILSAIFLLALPLLLWSLGLIIWLKRRSS